MSGLQCWYTAFNVTNIKLSTSGGGSLYLPGQFETFTPADIAMRVENSKLEFASEQVWASLHYPSKAPSLAYPNGNGEGWAIGYWIIC
jgi:hypothetical protein